MPREEPRPLATTTATTAIARSVQESPQRLRSIDQWPNVIATVERIPGVIATSPSITGAGFAVRADAKSAIVIRGVEPDRFLHIIDVRARLVAGRFELDGGGVAIGSKLASDLGVGVGDKVRVTSSEGIDDVVTVRGVFSLGNQGVDATWLITSLRHAQTLFGLPGGVTTIELKVADVFSADRIARDIAGATDLTADSWMTINAELLTACRRSRAARG